MPNSRARQPHDPESHAEGQGQGGLAGLIVCAVGGVFGDIGTSPLYTIKERFHPQFGLTPDAETVKGLLSLGFWSLILVVTLKYVIVIMRADNDGEGGIMALTALAQGSFDFVVTDWNLPGMTGIELLKAIRADDRFKTLPVLMVTAEAKREQLIEAAQNGVNGYIIKPFTAATLEDKLVKIFERMKKAA